jgi:L-threonylcarbamoyladenylate synthase
MRVLDVQGECPNPEAVAQAAALLARGELLIYPTDTLYAVGCCALDGAAVERLRITKAREAGKPLPVVAADETQARTLWATWPSQAAVLAERFWPGPLTLILGAGPGLPTALTAGAGSVGVRVPGLSLTRALCAAAGPLVSTSANPAGGLPPTTCREAQEGLEGAVALALDAGPGRGTPSTLLDLTAAEPRLLREGAVPWAMIAPLLKRRGAC